MMSGESSRKDLYGELFGEKCSPCDKSQCVSQIDSQRTLLQNTLLLQSARMNPLAFKVKGYDFDEDDDGSDDDRNQGRTYKGIVESFISNGFQSSNVALAIQEINKMIYHRNREKIQTDFNEPALPFTLFLGYTSNMVSCGLRETIKYLVKHKQVDVLVTTCGGVEEDLIKCLHDFYVGDFFLDGASLRSRGINRIGNLLVPNDAYCKFEDWITPILHQMLQEQIRSNVVWTPSMFIARLGAEIKDESSICYWANKNGIPIFCPGLTDGSIGDMLYMHSFKKAGFIIDIVADIKRINDVAINSKMSGQILLGGGLPKHHINNANLMKNGADFSVNVNTANFFDGSDSGALPDEAVSWGKIKSSGCSVKVNCEASIIFPIIVAETFAKSIKKEAKAKKTSTNDSTKNTQNSSTASEFISKIETTTRIPLRVKTKDQIE